MLKVTYSVQRPAKKRQAIPGIVTEYVALAAMSVMAAHAGLVETKTVVLAEVALQENGGAAVTRGRVG